MREAIYAQPFYRLVHAEGDGLPGLTIDRFGDTLVVQITTAGMELLIDPLLAALEKTVAPATVILRNDAPSRALEGLERICPRREGRGRRASRSRKTARAISPIWRRAEDGLVLRPARQPRLHGSARQGHAACSTPIAIPAASASLAAKAGAKEVVCLDSSAPALAHRGGMRRGERRDDANSSRPMCSRNWSVSPAAKETFDIVIADPPPFVKARKDLEPGAKAYRKLARLAASVTAPGGFLLARLLLAQHRRWSASRPNARPASRAAIAGLR